MNPKFFIFTTAALFLARISQAQDQLDFSNFQPPAARVYLPSLGYLGSNYVAELYWAPGVVSNPANLQYLGLADTPLRELTGGDPNTTDAGYFGHFQTIALPATGVVTLAIDVDQINSFGFFDLRGQFDGAAGSLAEYGYFHVGGSQTFQVTLSPNIPPNIVSLPNQLTWTVVPEPSSMSLALFAGLCCFLTHRKHKPLVTR